MAVVIRDARIEPGRVLLAVIARAGTARADTARAEPVEPAGLAAVVPDADGASAATATGSAAGLAAPARHLQVEREAEDHAFRQRLEAERLDVLARAQAEGFEAGRQRGEAGYADQLAALAAVIASARGTLEAGIADTEDVMVEIAFEVICRILGDTMQQSAGVVAVVREVLRGVRERERLLVRVSPADFAVLETHRAQLLEGEDGRTIDLVADERVVLGGCLVETTGGTLDGRLETQLQRLVETLTSARRMQGEGGG